MACKFKHTILLLSICDCMLTKGVKGYLEFLQIIALFVNYYHDHKPAKFLKQNNLQNDLTGILQIHHVEIPSQSSFHKNLLFYFISGGHFFFCARCLSNSLF